MGSIYSRKNKKGDTWYIQYYFNGDPIKEKVGQSWRGVTRKQAAEALKSREGDIVQGKFNIAQTKSYPRFDKQMDAYLDWAQVNKKSTTRDIVSAKHLKPFFGKKHINEITSFMVEQYKKSRKDEIKVMPKNKSKSERDISFVSINRELSLLKHFYTMAMKWDVVDRNPVKGVKMFPERIRERYLSKEEIDALLSACGKSKNRHLKTIVITAISTGTRLQETLTLKVGDLDFKNSIINLEHTKNGDKGKIPMNEHLRAVLKEHLNGHRHEYLFCDERGTRFANVQKAFKNACKLAGIKNFWFHDLRHTFASHLARCRGFLLALWVKKLQ